MPARSVEWYTPPDIFRALRLEFDLDPCAPAWPYADWIPALKRIALPQDGMAGDWSGRVWLNPPYGREAARWVRKLADHGDWIALVFARTDTSWWQYAVERASAVCFVLGRINFIPRVQRTASNGTASSSRDPACLIAFGDECAAAVARSGLGVRLVAEEACVSAQTELWES